MSKAPKGQSKSHEVSLLVEHSVKYTNQNPLTVKEVVNSLNALNKVSVYFLPQALSTLSGAEVMTADLLVEGFEHGSFVEKVLIRLFFKDEAELEKFLDKVRDGSRELYRNLPGEGRPVLKGAVAVSCVVGSLVAVGAMWAISTRQDAPSPVTLNINDSNFVVIGAESYELSPTDFVKVIEATGRTDQKQLAQASVNLLAPAKSEEGAVMMMDDNAQLSIPRETVEALPDNVDFQPYETEQPYSDVDLQIRASDRDNSSRGWAGIIDGVVDRRVRLELSEGVSPDDIAAKFVVRADVVVHYRMSRRSKKLEPVLISVVSIIK